MLARILNRSEGQKESGFEYAPHLFLMYLDNQHSHYELTRSTLECLERRSNLAEYLAVASRSSVLPRMVILVVEGSSLLNDPTYVGTSQRIGYDFIFWGSVYRGRSNLDDKGGKVEMHVHSKNILKAGSWATHVNVVLGC